MTEMSPASAAHSETGSQQSGSHQGVSQQGGSQPALATHSTTESVQPGPIPSQVDQPTVPSMYLLLNHWLLSTIIMVASGLSHTKVVMVGSGDEVGGCCGALCSYDLVNMFWWLFYNKVILSCTFNR